MDRGCNLEIDRDICRVCAADFSQGSQYAGEGGGRIIYTRRRGDIDINAWRMCIVPCEGSSRRESCAEVENMQGEEGGNLRKRS